MIKTKHIEKNFQLFFNSQNITFYKKGCEKKFSRLYFPKKILNTEI